MCQQRRTGQPKSARRAIPCRSILPQSMVTICMIEFSAILLHTLPVSAQCDYNAIDNGGYRKPLQNP